MFFKVHLHVSLLFHIKDSNSWKRNRPRFSLPQPYRTSIYTIAIVKISNRAIQNLFNCPQWACMGVKLRLFPIGISKETWSRWILTQIFRIKINHCNCFEKWQEHLVKKNALTHISPGCASYRHQPFYLHRKSND